MTDDDLHDRLLDSGIEHLAAGIDAALDGDTQTAHYERRQCKQAIEGARSLTNREEVSA
jgi:hypothetical protein